MDSGRTHRVCRLHWMGRMREELGADPGASGWGTGRATEDEMVGWHHRFNGHELGQTLGDGEGQGGLMCCGLWARKESDTTW